MQSHGAFLITRAVNGWVVDGPGRDKRIFDNLGDLMKFLHDWVQGDDDDDDTAELVDEPVYAGTEG